MIAFPPRISTPSSPRTMARMLNLLRFRPDGGRKRYLEYVNMVGPLVTRHGAKILYAGDCATPLPAEPGGLAIVSEY
jgi:hypothetical protein